MNVATLILQLQKMARPDDRAFFASFNRDDFGGKCELLKLKFVAVAPRICQHKFSIRRIAAETHLPDGATARQTIIACSTCLAAVTHCSQALSA